MNIRNLSTIVLAFAFTVAAGAQDTGSAQPSGQNAGQNASSGSGDYGQRGGRGGGMGGGMGMMMGRRLMGIVTEAAADHYTIKTDAGDVYTVHFTADTRIFKQVARQRGPGEGAGAGDGQGQGRGQGSGGGGGRGYGGGNPPQQIKSSDIKVGDAIDVMGSVDATSKSAAATRIAQLDPAVVQQYRAMEADFGKTWLMGKVTAIDGAKITLTGVIDNALHTVVADENTSFRKRRDPITLADIQVGDTVRADGAVKDGVFTASSVNVFGMGGGETPTVPRGGDAPQVPHSAPPQ
ncbi:MAG: DUF5666 domain-containing protein [Terracidiphilus sp.]|jgi:hypothetical protein